MLVTAKLQHLVASSASMLSIQWQEKRLSSQTKHVYTRLSMVCRLQTTSPVAAKRQLKLFLLCHVVQENLSQEASTLKADNGELRAKLEESKQQLHSNEQMIRWLNQQVGACISYSLCEVCSAAGRTGSQCARWREAACP